MPKNQNPYFNNWKLNPDLELYLENNKPYLYDLINKHFDVCEKHIYTCFDTIRFDDAPMDFSALTKSRLEELLANLKKNINIETITNQTVTFVKINLAFLMDALEIGFPMQSIAASLFKNFVLDGNWAAIYSFLDKIHDPRLEELRFINLAIGDVNGNIHPKLWLYLLVNYENFAPSGVPFSRDINVHGKFFSSRMFLIIHDQLHYGFCNETLSLLTPEAKQQIIGILGNLLEKRCSQKDNRTILFLYYFLHEHLDEIQPITYQIYSFFKFIKVLIENMPSFNNSNLINYCFDNPDVLFYSNDLKFLLRDVGFNIPKLDINIEKKRINLFVILGILHLLLEFISDYPETARNMGFFMSTRRADFIQQIVKKLDEQVNLTNHYTEKMIAAWKKMLNSFTSLLQPYLAESYTEERSFNEKLAIMLEELMPDYDIVIEKILEVNVIAGWVVASYLSSEDLRYLTSLDVESLKKFDDNVFTFYIENKIFTIKELFLLDMSIIALLKNEVFTTKLNINKIDIRKLIGFNDAQIQVLQKDYFLTMIDSGIISDRSFDFLTPAVASRMLADNNLINELLEKIKTLREVYLEETYDEVKLPWLKKKSYQATCPITKECLFSVDRSSQDYLATPLAPDTIRPGNS